MSQSPSISVDYHEVHRSGFPALVTALRSQLPGRCALSGGLIGMPCASKYQEEEELVRLAVPKRRFEFRAGRQYARDCLAELGVESSAILAHPERDPVWPKGCIGTISHCDSAAIALVTVANSITGIGIDLDDDEPLSQTEAALICRPSELETQMSSNLIPKLIFVAKEAYYKAVFPSMRCFLDFQDVSVEIDSHEQRLKYINHKLSREKRELYPRVTGTFLHIAGYYVCACWVEARDAGQIVSGL